jgi:hypothetical protein
MKTTIDMAREAGLLAHIPFRSDTEVSVSLKAFEALIRADERENFCAALRQMHDAYSLASDPLGLKVRGNT